MTAATGFVPNVALVHAEGASPTSWMFLLHGIFGSGANFRTFARRLAAKVPRWGFALVDLRAHGASLHPPPPNTLDEAALDLDRLATAKNIEPAAIAGHSFGGKVALAYLAKRASSRTLESAWILDANPGRRADASSGLVPKILALLEGLPDPLPSREFFFEEMQANGVARPTAEWLAMNVRRDGDVLRLRLHLPTIRRLLTDYFDRDLWQVVEEASPSRCREIRFVIGGRSDAFPPEDRARLDAIAAQHPAVRVDVLEASGHWLHVDDPDGLEALFVEALAARR